MRIIVFVLIIYCCCRGETSEITHAILGLNLLYLLVENRLADFHCEVCFLFHSTRMCPLLIGTSPVCLVYVIAARAAVGEGEAIGNSDILHPAGQTPCGGLLRPGKQSAHYHDYEVLWKRTIVKKLRQSIILLLRLESLRCWRQLRIPPQSTILSS